jgi:Rhodanese-like domain
VKLARIPHLAAALAAVLLLAPAARAGEPLRLISVDDVERQLGTPGFHVYDANGLPIFAKGHVPGAVHVSYRTLSEKDLPADRDARLVFYCKDRR